MDVRKVLLGVGVCLVASCLSLGARSKYLDDQKVTATEEQVVQSLRKMAQRLAAEKEQKKQKKLALIEEKKQAKLAKLNFKKQKKAARAEQKRLDKEAHLEKKRLAKKIAHEKELIRKAIVLEAKRRKRIVSWRDFTSTKRAATVLLKEADGLDVSNQLHVEELSREVKRFAAERLAGSLQEYPELEWLARL